MVRERLRRVDERGFTLAELMIVMVMIGVLSIVTTPMLLSYWRTSTLGAGARELASAINLGRQLAISRNTTVCVEVNGTNIQMRTGGCAGTIWTGPGTDSAGVVRVSNPSDLQVSAGGSVVFTNLGAASTAGTFTITNPADGGTRSVVVAASGQVRVQ
ncbi:MAG: GspH/FimT family pseudopilin [Candidatus Rokubacteria bacterium]|nr:GspH/FimT family pseudopilin [Candidatus Rokubacteria bacterium]MBI2493042.1 GspH/FimT family pseudopilin [Candidatus Rokubacteria bacterium]MBI4254070.1 GspH/FimT family pseudopilin [Candidatus Rokubacteria bacterium]